MCSSVCSGPKAAYFSSPPVRFASVLMSRGSAPTHSSLPRPVRRTHVSRTAQSYRPCSRGCQGPATPAFRLSPIHREEAWAGSIGAPAAWPTSGGVAQGALHSLAVRFGGPTTPIPRMCSRSSASATRTLVGTKSSIPATSTRLDLAVAGHLGATGGNAHGGHRGGNALACGLPEEGGGPRHPVAGPPCQRRRGEGRRAHPTSPCLQGIDVAVNGGTRVK